MFKQFLSSLLVPEDKFYDYATIWPFFEFHILKTFGGGVKTEIMEKNEEKEPLVR